MAEQAISGDALVPPIPMRVLIADDDPAIRLICSTWLNLDGYEVIEATNGQDALDLAFTQTPDLVLLDLSMPVLDGLTVAARLRADERTREVPFIVLTGETGREISERVHNAGAAGFFTKPFDPGAVTEFVRSVVAEIRAARGQGAVLGGHAV